MPRFDLALFDMDGTLADTVASIHASMERTFRDFGAEPPCLEAVRRAIGQGLDHTIHTLNPALDQAEVPAWTARYREHYMLLAPELSRLFPGMARLLRSLHESGTALGVVSNKSEQAVVASAHHLGLDGLASFLAGARPDRPLKPDARLYDMAVRPLFPDLEPGRVLMVGDDVPDLAFARNVGMRSCWVSYGYGEPDECLAQRPDHVAATVDELASVLLAGR